MYSVIKIGGFALGIAACFLIAMYIRHELSYDRNYKDGDRIYRVVQVQDINGKIIPSTVLQAPLAETMKKEFPEIENYIDRLENNIGLSDEQSDKLVEIMDKYLSK